MTDQKNLGATKYLYLFFLTPFIINILLGGSSTSLVVSGGFSVRNYSEVGMLAILALFIYNNKDYYIDTVIRSKNLRPFFMLSILYISSTLWSQYPLLTLFKSVEFLIISLVAIAAFNDNQTFLKSNHTISEDLDLIKHFLFHLMVITFLHGFLHKLAFSESFSIFMMSRDNLFSNILGGLLIFYIYLFAFKKIKSKFIIFIPILYIGTFSLATMVNFFISLIFLFLSKFNKVLGLLFIVSFIVVSVIHLFFFQIDFALNMLSLISTRPVEHLVSLSGRSHIWDLMFQSFSQYRFGAGYATDMVILMENFQMGSIKTVSSAHNIYIEAFIAAKWVGVFVMLYAYFFWFVKAKKNFVLDDSILIRTLILFCLLCGFTNSGFGGSYASHPYLYFWIVFIPHLKRVKIFNKY